MASADPIIASTAASIAAQTAVARLSADERKQRMAPAHEARLKAYLDQVDPDGKWTEEERIAAAKNLMAADMARLSLLGVEARKKRREQAKQLAKAS